ncbi:MAG TPA: glycosyltransferase [Gemmatimonadota bacterium]|nr:glycosyltransferase [Gemmatimonadota bacterium]
MTAGAAPRFTIVVPTRNRPRQLVACLEAIGALRYPREEHETLVVLDGTPIHPDVRRAAERARARLLYQPATGPAAARNLGAAEARGDVIAFLDDDCAPDPDWLRELDSALAALPGGGAGGRTLNALTDNRYSSASQTLVDYLYEYYNRESAREPLFTTNNLALPRVAFLELGGFDARFRRAGGEDRELCLRWARSGRGIAYAPRAIVRHSHDLSLRRFLRQHFNYGRGAARFHEIRESSPIPEPASFYRELILYPWRERTRGRARMSALLTLSQAANVAGYAWEARRRR